MRQPRLADQENAIAYDSIGSGPPILFIHGLTYDRRMWRPVIEQLRHDFTCIAVDLPGHGASSDAQSYDLGEVTGRIQQTVARLGVDAPIVVGHSMGAILALGYCSQYPCAGLVTSDQPLRTLPFLQRLHGMRGALESPGFMGIWRAIERELGIERIPQPYRELVEGASNPRQTVVLGYWREAFDTPPAELQARAIDLARCVSAPFTAVFGDEPGADYRAWLEPVAAHCKIVVFPDAGHFPHLVEIDRFAQAVRALAGSAP